MIHKLHKFLRWHLSDKELTLFATGDLPAHRKVQVDHHLSVCSKCTVRRERFENSFLQATAYLAQQTRTDRSECSARRARLEARLSLISGDIHEMAQSQRAQSRMSALSFMTPLWAAGLVLVVTCSTGVFVQMHKPKPKMTPNTFLARAEAWDSVALQEKRSGVIRQTVKITTEKQTVRHRMYHDAQGKRKCVEQNLTPDEDSMMRRLAEADISWDAPLSAGSYREWHDAQHARVDRVHLSGKDLLVLTTTAPDGAITAQSLTVRDSDFHPVQRTVSYRDGETVEIAELDYSVLPWSPQVSSLFQPEEDVRRVGLAESRPAFVPLPPLPLTEEQLNEAELSTRLTLSRLHADTGEQIEVVRSSRGIEVHGMIEAEKRRKELETQLHFLPHVTTFLSSVEKMRSKPAASDELSSVKVIAMQTQATVLETYYLSHGRSVAPLGDLSRRLYDSAFAIRLESRAIDDLERRFAHDGEISTIAWATLSDLLFTHKHKLLTALKDEEEMLAGARITTPRLRQDTSANGTSLALASLADRNLLLTKELVLSSGSNLSAETIASELAASLSDLNLKTHDVQVVPRNFTKLDKSK